MILSVKYYDNVQSKWYRTLIRQNGVAIDVLVGYDKYPAEVSILYKNY